MGEFVLDASVAMSWCFPGEPTEDTPYSRQILHLLLDQNAIVPEIWAFEIANSIFVAHSKRRRIDEQQVAEYLGLLRTLPIRVDPQPLWVNVGLESSARRWNLSAYDAAYLVLALRRRVPLATSDEKLKQAAFEAGVVVLADVDDHIARPAAN